MAEEQYEISSEIYKEFDYKSNLKPIFNENCKNQFNKDFILM